MITFRRSLLGSWQLGLVLMASVGILAMTGCTGEKPVPPAKVQTVTAYGLTLDENATPEQVAFVLLRSLADDVQAAQAHEHVKQEEALHRTFSLAAYNTIERRFIEAATHSKARQQNSLGEKRDRKLFEVVELWGSIVAYYVPSFDTDPQQAMAKMQSIQQGKAVHIRYPVAHVPSASDPAQRQEQTLDIELTQEQADGKSYWRVARIDYVPKVALSPTTTPATATAPN